MPLLYPILLLLGLLWAVAQSNSSKNAIPGKGGASRAVVVDDAAWKQYQTNPFELSQAQWQNLGLPFMAEAWLAAYEGKTFDHSSDVGSGPWTLPYENPASAGVSFVNHGGYDEPLAAAAQTFDQEYNSGPTTYGPGKYYYWTALLEKTGRPGVYKIP